MDMDHKPLNKAQREHHHYLTDVLARVDYDMHHRIWINQRVPADWHRIATSPTPHKRRVTIRVDEDVLKFFRSIGRDYGPRMNDVLRAFMHARLMGLLNGDETIDQFKAREESGPHERPEFGWADRKLAERKARRGR